MTTAGLEDMMKRVETLEERVDVRNEPPFDRLSQMNHQTDTLLKLQEATSLSLGQIQRTGVNTQDRTLKVMGIVSKVQLDVEFMRTDLAHTHEDVNDLVSSVQSLGQQVNEVKKEVREQISEVRDEVKEVRDEVKEVRDEVKEVRDEVKEIRGDVRNLQTAVAGLQEGQNTVLTMLTQLVGQR